MTWHEQACMSASDGADEWYAHIMQLMRAARQDASVETAAPRILYEVYQITLTSVLLDNPLKFLVAADSLAEAVALLGYPPSYVVGHSTHKLWSESKGIVG